MAAVSMVPTRQVGADGLLFDQRRHGSGGSGARNNGTGVPVEEVFARIEWRLLFVGPKGGVFAFATAGDCVDWTGRRRWLGQTLLVARTGDA